MDPRFQPQNNPSYPQNPTYNPPQNQTGPNLYPTLPPVNNPQYQPPAQHYPGYYPQNNPYHPSAAHGGYLPLTNYGNGPNQEVNAESVLYAEKIRELEKGLDSCFIKCYQGWLWLTIICCGMSVFKTFVTLVSSTEQSDLPILLLAALLYSIWAILQSVFGIQAISQKNLTKANVACVMMFIYVIPSILATIWLIVIIANHVPDKRDDAWHLWYAVMGTFLIGAALNTLFGIFVNLFGAFKVRKILSERNVLQEKIDRSDDSIQA